MAQIDFISKLHNSTKRDYLARVTDPTLPKAKAAELAKKFDYHYWDGDRRICYGGYKYIPGRWEAVANDLNNHYKLPQNAKILDIGCGKGYLLFDFLKILPDADIYGLDISSYAIENSKDEIKDKLTLGNATSLPWPDNYFDFVISINSLHCLPCYELEKALTEMERVGKDKKYLCIESFRNENEKANLLYWQNTCESFHNPQGWDWWFKKTKYSGDHSFIFFE